MFRPKTPVFLLVKAGTTIYKPGMPGKSLPTTTEQAKTDFVAKTPSGSEWDSWRWENIPDNCVLINDYDWIDENDVNKIKVPSLTKDRRAILVNNSVWEVDEDLMLFVDRVDSVPFKETRIDLTIPKGMQIKIIKAKSAVQYKLCMEACIIVEMDEVQYWLPKRFIGGMTCVEQGAQKTYWRMLDKHGELVRKKRYKNLAAIKGSVRIITGVLTVDDSSGEDGPWWLDGAAAAPGFTSGDSDLETFDDWVAVEYAAVGDVELQRVELAEWFTHRKLHEMK